MSETIEIEPKEFRDDMQGGRKHYSELVKEYPDKWVAIVDGEVVSVGDSPKMVEKDAEKKTGKRQNMIPLIFVFLFERKVYSQFP